MSARRVLDLVIVASVALWVAVLVLDPFLLQIITVVPLSLTYAFAEVAVPLVRGKLGGQPDALAAERHRVCMLLYMQGITVAQPLVAVATLAYAILLRATIGRARWVGHAVGCFAVVAATLVVEPRGLVACAPVPTLVGLAIWVLWVEPARDEPK